MVVAPSVCNVILCPTVIFVGKMYLSALVIILHFPIIFSKPDNTSTFKIALIHQDNEFYLMEWSRNILNKLKPKHEYDILDISIKGDEKIDDNVFGDLSAEKPLLILDASWYQKEEADVSITNEIPYFKMDLFFSPFVEVLEKYLETRNAGDILMILEKSQLIDNFLYFWIRNSRLRMYLVEWYDSVTMMRLRNLRPTPTNYVLLGSQATLEEVLNLALQENAFELSDKFLFISTEVNEAKLNNSLLGSKSYNLLQFSVEECCRTRISSDSCLCEKNLSIHQLALNVLLKHTVEILDEIITDSLQISNRQGEDDRVKTNSEKLEEFFIEALPKNHVIFQNRTLKLKYDAVVENINKFNSTTIAKFVNNEFIVHNESIKPMRAFFRVGIAEALPWSFKVTNSKTGTSVWTGYCADFTEKLSEMMNFDYEFVEPINGSFGEKINGVWNGVIGDLVSGKTDLAISAITMTADREEVVDFVAPYFEQTGITIVMRKPVRKTSLFKFMTVLKLEVWLSIVMALVITGCMVWFLDKYSPYSARNNKEAYPYPCRLFSIKESFWFALTSFTPQGGGEAPKALSGRTLVAAYWLFVVLMLATFTANLAAFLTVERMQAPVQSLEQLARQSRINYTVVEGSDTHKYFINMKNAEDILYRMWKELTLNASSDDTRYRVWDYPIKEQYGHILLAINDSKPVSTAEEGFEKVNEHLNADYAFIHDSSEIKYKISHNCNLTEVGEVFAERPYAVAVQQGSYLQDEISKVILKLQKDRFFDFLHGKYWNHSKGGYCPNTDDNEGITLESLGGVFIATLFGLALALMTLAAEVFYYRKQHESTNKKNQQIPWNKNKTSLITSTLVKPTQDKLILNSFASIPKSSVALGFRKNNRIQFLN